ncbi:MAG TPA: glutathione binding-like protein [Gammaproteobacteria bacterium]|nr:glutathione binding-like protein [Gammaproteobacteria bacterium]
MMKLYYSPGACSMAPHILLEEIGVPYELVLVAISEGKTRAPEYLAINSKGRVPALLTAEGEILTEVPAISCYLAEHSAGVKLLPQGGLPLARCLEWFNWLSGTVHTMAFGQFWRAHRFLDDEQLFPPLKDKGRRNILDHFAFIEGRLKDRNWAVGQAYTAVDAYLLVFFRWGHRIGLDMRPGYPHWNRHAERVLERPAVQRALQQEGVSAWGPPEQ